MLLPWSASSCCHSCPASPLLSYTYTSQPYPTSPPPPPHTSTTTSLLVESLSKLLSRPSQKQYSSRPLRLSAACTTTPTAHSTPTPITIKRSAPVNVPTANVSSVVGSYPPDQTNNLATKFTQPNCTDPRNPFTRKLDDNPLPLRFLQAPDTLETCSNHIQISQPSRTVNDTSTSTYSFPPDPVPLATFSYSEIPFLDDLQLEDEGDELEQDREKSDRTMGYLPLRRTQDLTARRRFQIISTTTDYPSSPSTSRLFSPSLSPSSFFAPTIPPAVHLDISRRNLPPILYESVQRSHEAIVNGCRSPVRRIPLSPPRRSDGRDPPPRSQVRDIRSNSAHYLMRATEKRMILARKLAAPLKLRAVLPRRTVSFTPCGSRLAATTWQDL